MTKIKIMTSCIIYALFVACQSGSGEKYDLKGYVTESIGGGATSAQYYDQNKWPLSKGHVINGVRNGIWTTYHPNSYKIKSVTNYINGKKNGPEISLNDRGSVLALSEYKNDALHGSTVRYKNSRVLNETNYADGEMDGPFKVYDENNGKIQRSGSFRKGKQHGYLLFYDGEGNITLKYEYKDGEKLSGGIVE